MMTRVTCFRAMNFLLKLYQILHMFIVFSGFDYLTLIMTEIYSKCMQYINQIFNNFKKYTIKVLGFWVNNDILNKVNGRTGSRGYPTYGS